MSEFKLGIYLEIKKASIGTGVTAKSEEYRSFWMTSSIKDNIVSLILLDDDFKLTYIEETVPLSDFESEKYTYIPQGEKKFQILQKKYIERLTAKKQTAAKKQQPQQSKPKSTKWWESESKELTADEIFSTTSSSKKEEGPQSETGQWWQSQSSVFKRESKENVEATKRKPAKSEVRIKKSWWESS